MWQYIVDNWQHWYWCVIGLICLGLEVALPGVVFLWVATAAFVTWLLVLAIPVLGLGIQLISFAILSMVLVYVSHKYFKKNAIETDKPNLSNMADQYIGKYYDIYSDIENGVGKIKAGDSYWRVEGKDMPKGTRVIVTGCNGATLTVKKADEEEENSEPEADKTE